MNKSFIVVIIIVFYSIQLFKAQAPKVYINLVSHNEENYTYLTNSSSYFNVRPKLVQMAQLASSKGAKWHMGNDHIILRAALAYDSGTITASTGGTNVLRYISTTYSNNVECDTHAHETVYNNADVAKLSDSLGIPPNGVISGFLYNGLASGHDWQDYQVPNNGDVFPNYYWSPEILWGAATPGHTADPHYYGMWKPESMSNFFTHKASNHLINYGQGCKLEVHDTSQIVNIMNQLRYITNAIQTGAAPANGFYCTSIFFRESYLNVPGFISTKLDDLIDSINVLVSTNKVEWKFIPEVVNIWKTTYNSQPFVMDCNLTVLTTVEENEIKSKVIRAYPNPANDILVFNEELTDIEVRDIYGRLILPIVKSSKIMNTQGFMEGIYFIKSKQAHIKFVVKH